MRVFAFGKTRTVVIAPKLTSIKGGILTLRFEYPGAVDQVMAGGDGGRNGS